MPNNLSMRTLKIVLGLAPYARCKFSNLSVSVKIIHAQNFVRVEFQARGLGDVISTVSTARGDKGRPDLGGRHVGRRGPLVQALNDKPAMLVVQIEVPQLARTLVAILRV